MKNDSIQVLAGFSLAALCLGALYSAPATTLYVLGAVTIGLGFAGRV